jgi:hypothetical protein
MAQLDSEITEKVRAQQASIVQWNDIKADPPRDLKVSPIAMVPHKSRAYRAILDLSFSFNMGDGSRIPSVNSTTTKTAPKGSIDQLGHALNRIIYAFAEADPHSTIFMAKWDIKDGFWRLACESTKEWSFAYVLPSTHNSDAVSLVVPTSLQMGWIESPAYFCAASETARDVAATYAEMPIGSLADHKFLHYTQTSHAFKCLPRHEPTQSNLCYFSEVFVDDFIQGAIAENQAQLNHLSNATMHGIHDVFPSDQDDENDPISEKKLKKTDGAWDTQKDLLGLTFNGVEKTVWLPTDKRDALLNTLSEWITQVSQQAGIHFPAFEATLSKLQHAFLTIPAGRGLLSPFYTILGLRPEVVFLHQNKPLLHAVRDSRTFLRESVSNPTNCRSLVPNWPDYIGLTDASAHGLGGVIVGENAAVPPTVFRLQWPPDITQNIVSETNPTGTITNSDLEMAGLLMLWLVMEDVCGALNERHVALFSDNSPTVHWVQRMAAKHSAIAMQLVRALALRLQLKWASPLTTLHIAGVDNAITDIPSRSFGSEQKWFCPSDTDLLRLFNTSFPLPHQGLWNVYHVSSKIATRLISVLRMQVSTLDEWHRLPSPGRSIGPAGSPMSHLWEWTLTYRTPHSHSKPACSPDTPQECDQDIMVEDGKYGLIQSLRRSQPLEWRFPWPQG